MFLEIHATIIDYKKQNLNLNQLCANIPGWKSFGEWIDKGDYISCVTGYMHCFGGYYYEIFSNYDLFCEINGEIIKFGKPESKIFDFPSALIFVMLCLGNYKNLTKKFQIIIKNQNILESHREEIEKIRNELIKFVSENNISVEIVYNILENVDIKINENVNLMKNFTQIGEGLKENMMKNNNTPFNEQEKDTLFNILNDLQGMWDSPQIDHHVSLKILETLSKLHESIEYIKI